MCDKRNQHLLERAFDSESKKIKLKDFKGSVGKGTLIGYNNLGLSLNWEGIMFNLVSILVIIKMFVAIVIDSLSVIFLWNKSGLVEHLGKGVKNVFNQVRNNMWKRWCLRLAVLPLYSNHLINLLCKTMRWFLCNGSTSLKWQNWWMV